MLGIPLETIKAFILDCDLAQNRQWKLWIGGQIVTQSNGSNPKIIGVDVEKSNQISISLDRIVGSLYDLRIVKDDAIAPLIRADKSWALQFETSDKFSVKVLPPIGESKIQGLAWHITVEANYG